MKTFEKETFRESFIKVKLLGKASAKAQSAMEYLMTYGWAILIIAVVLGALFELGVFNANNFAPKAPPGACQVFRPNGPGTTSFINLEGVCTGEMPQYVAVINNGGGILVPEPKPNNWNGGYTATVWVNYIPPVNFCGYLVGIGNSTGNPRGGLVGGCGNWGNQAYPYAEACPMPDAGCSGAGTGGNYEPLNTGTWYFLAGVWNPQTKTITLYINGQFSSSGTNGATPANFTPPGPAYYFDIPGLDGSSISIKAEMSNAQLYNTSLSANDIQALYLEGIGGAPIDLQNLVGWWPLNGNANDYSGNGNNGQINNVNFVGNWYSGYTPP